MTTTNPRSSPWKPENVGLPTRAFLYTLDQVAVMLSISVNDLKLTHVYFDGLSTGRQPPRLLKAHNINPDLDAKPDWRVSEQELIRWLRSRGFRYHERGWVE